MSFGDGPTSSKHKSSKKGDPWPDARKPGELARELGADEVQSGCEFVSEESEKMSLGAGLLDENDKLMRLILGSSDKLSMFDSKMYKEKQAPVDVKWSYQ